jgi:NADPH-dependent 2,4-dienoyl-CoA reductase/sulfur reductase-like enzyme
MNHPVVIVGASMGGLRTAESLRRFGYDGPITIIGEEVHKPYNRPPLSKDALAQEVSHAAVAFEERAAISDVNWVLGTRAVSLDLDKNTVTDSSECTHQFSALVIATGLRPKRLSYINGHLSGRFSLRTLDDAIALRERLKPGTKVVIVGGGFIGCEVAATAIQLGCEVTVVHNAAHPMLRPLGTDLAREMQLRHEQQGVKFFLKRSVVEFVGETSIQEVILDDGSSIPCDVLVEATGSQPNTEWLEMTDINISDGVRVDNAMRAMTKSGQVIQNVFAIGDVAAFVNPIFDDEPRRVEHWNIPTETAKRAASVLAASITNSEKFEDILSAPFKPLPSFWSDQYDVHLLAFGSLALADRVSLVAGEAGGDCVFEYHRGKDLVGVCGIGMRNLIQSYRMKFN